MKISNYLRVKLLLAFLLLLSIKTNAQCPTITDNNPAICDAAGFTVQDLNTFVTDNGGGIRYYDSATSTMELANNETVSDGDVFFVDSITNDCGNRETITVNFTVKASGITFFNTTYCSNDTPTLQDVFNDTLNSSIPSGGSVTIYSDSELTNALPLTTELIAPLESYFIVFSDNAGCRSQFEIGVFGMGVSESNPTPNNPQEFCLETTSSPTVGDLVPAPEFGITHWYNMLDANGNPTDPTMPLDATTTLIDGNTYYVRAEGDCPSSPVPVTINFFTSDDAGEPATLEYCENIDVPTNDFNLFDELGGTPQNTGIWTGPITTSNGHLGTVNINGQPAGQYVFTYTTPENGACPENTATITIIISETLSAGNRARRYVFCQESAPNSFNLGLLLDNEDPGGQWTLNGNVINTPFDLSTLAVDSYIFTYTQNINNPCPNVSRSGRITIEEDPDAGVANNPEPFCEDELTTDPAFANFDLFSILNRTQTTYTGEWTDADGNVINNIIDISGFTVANSPYNFTFTVNSLDCDDAETVTIAVVPSPESGTANAQSVFCEGLAPSDFNLFDQISDEDPNGTWYVGTDNTGATTADTVNLSTLPDGTYNYTYEVTPIGNCTDDLVTITVIINNTPSAGTITNPAPFCIADVTNTAFDLESTRSGGVNNGIWSDESGSGALTGSSVNLTQLPVGTYEFNYTVRESANGITCGQFITTTITIQEAPEAGTGTDIAFCLIDIDNTSTLNLFDQLANNDAGGVWSDTDGSTALTGNVVDLFALTTNTSFTFTYTVAGTGSCNDDTAVVEIIINETSAPTVADTTQNFCESATIEDLSVTGTNIIWYADATSTDALPNTTSLENGLSYFASQTDVTTNCESSTRTEVVATINNTPNSGVATNQIICNDVSNFDLFTTLDGSQDAGGTWSDDDATGNLSGSTFDASATANGIYNFTYTVLGNSPCPNATTTVTITIESPVSSGTVTSPNIDLCSTDAAFDLFSNISGQTPGGSWSLNGEPVTSPIDPSTAVSGNYTYTVVSTCNFTSSSYSITVIEAANAGTDNSVTFCVSDGTVDLLTMLGGTPDATGTWTPLLDSGTNIFDPNIDNAGSYTYTVRATSPCTVNATATLNITVNDVLPPVVSDTNISFCLADNPTIDDLNSFITSGTSIMWYDSATSTIPLNNTDALLGDQDYYATQTGANGCASSLRTIISVSILNAPTPTLAANGNSFCINDTPTILTLTNNIIEYDRTLNNVLWYDSMTGGNLITPNTILTSGTTYYAALINPTSLCESNIRLAVNVDLSACGAITIPSGFSPNGDGVNDTFSINNLAFLYPNYELEFYNRYGNLVFKTKANQQDFAGKSNQSRLINKGDLPVGVYYYIIKFNDNKTPVKQGSLYLNR